MSNMFKKTLVAAALTAYASASYAVTVATPHANSVPTVASTEFVASKVAEAAAADRFVQLPNDTLRITPGVDYAVGDIIEVNFTGATLMAGITPTVVPGAAGTIAYQGVSATNSNTLVFAVTGAFVSGNANRFAVNGVRFQAATVTGPVTVTYRATNSAGTVVKDNFGDTSRVVLTTRSQYSSSVTAQLDAKVNTASRSRFVGSDLAAQTTDTFKFRIANRETVPAASGVWSNDLVVTDVNRLTVTIDGPFGSFTNDAGQRQSVLTCDNLAGTTQSVVTATADVNSRVAIRYTPAAAELESFVNEFTCTFNVTPVTSAIPLSEFRATLQLANGTNSRFASTAASVGQFTLDGALVQIPYMPYGDNITQVINVTNSGTVAGAVSVEAIDRTGKKYGPVSVGTVAAGTQVALAEAIQKALLGANMPANERAALTLVVNAPASAITAYSAYNVGGTGARIVVNSSNGK